MKTIGRALTLQTLLLEAFCDQAITVMVDATLGNGHDALKLKKLAKDATLYGFDLQEQAVKASEDRLKAEGLFEGCSFHCAGHEKMDAYVSGPVDLVLFNLGYLPGNKKGPRTHWTTTKEALKKALVLLKPRGWVMVMVYPGHPEGAKEKQALEGYLSTLDQDEVDVSHFHFLNQRNNPPELFLLEKK